MQTPGNTRILSHTRTVKTATQVSPGKHFVGVPQRVCLSDAESNEEVVKVEPIPHEETHDLNTVLRAGPGLAEAASVLNDRKGNFWRLREI